jgi:hypothetical protein
MDFDLLNWADSALLIVMNILLTVVAFRAYSAAKYPERSLFLLGISGVLGFLVAGCGLMLDYLRTDLLYNVSITLVIVGMIDTCLWIWAVRALLKRYLAQEAQLSSFSPGNG